jgi:hypothetical protein
VRSGEIAAEPLSAVDTAWLHMEDPTNLMMVTGVLVFEEPLDFGRVHAKGQGCSVAVSRIMLRKS